MSTFNTSGAVILLSTYNGAKYLSEQLDSIIGQTFKNWHLIVRDDASSDNTVDLLRSYQAKESRIRLISNVKGQNTGALVSYSTLLKYAIDNTDAEYFMFCDQDDVWFTDKIEISLKAIKDIENSTTNQEYRIPILIFTDKKVSDENLNMLSDSFFKYQKLNPNKMGLNSLIVQNIPSGCTMLFNRALANKASPIPEEAYMHDHWISLVASAFGKFKYLNSPSMLYRQHSKNVFGAKETTFWYFLNKLNFTEIRNLKKIIQQYTNQSMVFYQTYRDVLTYEQLEMLKDFSTFYNKNWLQRRVILIKHRITKHGFFRNLGLYLLF